MHIGDTGWVEALELRSDDLGVEEVAVFAEWNGYGLRHAVPASRVGTLRAEVCIEANTVGLIAFEMRICDQAGVVNRRASILTGDDVASFRVRAGFTTPAVEPELRTNAAGVTD